MKLTTAPLPIPVPVSSTVMINKAISWWKRDSPYHAFIYTNFIVALAGTPLTTFAVFQLQVAGFAIGTDLDGQPCTTYCIVPWGTQHLDLNAVLLYMNALTFALGGVVTIFIVAYADFWSAFEHLSTALSRL